MRPLPPKPAAPGQVRRGARGTVTVTKPASRPGWFIVTMPNGMTSEMGRRQIAKQWPEVVGRSGEESAAVQAVRLATEAGLSVRFVPKPASVDGSAGFALMQTAAQSVPTKAPAFPEQAFCDYPLGMVRTCPERVAGAGERRCIKHGGMPGMRGQAEGVAQSNVPARCAGLTQQAARCGNVPIAGNSFCVEHTPRRIPEGVRSATPPLARVREALEKAARHGVFSEGERTEVMTALQLLESRWARVELNVRTMAGTAIETVRGWAKVLRESMEGHP